MVLTKYGITGDMYRYLYERQGGRCPICQVATGKSKRLAVDHNHQTNAVRGLLCGSCNHKLLGGAHESVEVLQRAIDYLIDPPAYRYLREYSDESASA